MPTAQICRDGTTVLVADRDVIVRLAVSEYLRACGFRVIEASGGQEAKIVLQRGPEIHVLFADARLAGEDSGFALAQWVRRYRPAVAIVLTTGLENKSEAAAQLCSGKQKTAPPASHLRDRIRVMRERQTTRPSGGARRRPKARAS